MTTILALISFAVEFLQSHPAITFGIFIGLMVAWAQARLEKYYDERDSYLNR